MNQEIRNGPHLYVVGANVGNASKFQLFLCQQDKLERQCLLQITTAPEHNGLLDRAAYILKEMARRAQELEQEYQQVKEDPDAQLNYQFGFPEVVDSFIWPEEGRRINIVAFRNVDEVELMKPLSNITAKDHLRLDLRSSGWVMGKLLKLLAFAHDQGISIGLNSGANILIEPEQRHVLIFDWTAAQAHTGTIAPDLRRRDISRGAQAIITALGGSPISGAIPDDGESEHDQYCDFLRRLSRGSETNATRAHENFYEMIDAFWKREFYPFTMKPLGN